jgi:hypothetical protein
MSFSLIKGVEAVKGLLERGGLPTLFKGRKVSGKR